MRYFFILFVLVKSSFLIAQSSGEGQVVGDFSKFNPIPSSPNTAAFEKYGNIPVNVNTGTPGIDIPLHSIQLNNFSWPVHLSYHAGGFKPSDIATRVGLGWTIQTNGLISVPSFSGIRVETERRELNLNFNCSPYPTSNPYCDPQNPYDVNYALGVLNGVYNPSPEIFNLSMANGVNLKYFDGVSLPASDYKITGRILTDLDGNRYEFFADGENARTSVCLGMQTSTLPKTYYLTKIITAKGQEINFSYDTEEYGYQLAPLHIKKWLNSGQNQFCNVQYDNVDYYCSNSFWTSEKRLSSIVSSTGERISFYYSGRSDIPGSTKLDKIEVSYNAILLKSINFSYGYFGTGSDPNLLQLKLDQIEVLGNSGVEKSVHKFSYNSTQNLPSKIEQDIVFSGLNMTGYNVSKAGLLEKIEYPTGGFTSFDYEVLAQHGRTVVKNISDFSANGTQSGYREYEYTGVAYSVGTPEFIEYEDVYYFGLPAPPNCQSDEPCALPEAWLQTCHATTWKSQPSVYPGDEYADATPRFTSITEYYGSAGVNGKTEYLFSTPINNRDVYDVNYLNHDYLIEKKVFRNEGNNTYSLISKLTNEYEVPASNNGFWGLEQHPREHRAFARKIILLRPEMQLQCCNPSYNKQIFSAIYQEIDRRVTSLPVFQKKSTEILYTNVGSIVNETNYYYDNPSYLKPTRIEVVNSKGEITRTEIKYPSDFMGQPVYTEMVNRNYLNPEIEKIQTNLSINKELSRIKTNYQFWQNNSLIEPATIEKSIFGNALETEMTINSYDSKGHVLQLTGKDGVVTSFIWGYNSQYPVAKIVNAPYSTAQSYISQTVLDNATGGTDDAAIRGHLNNLRNIANTFVTTYTYRPLIGITSETDPNGRTTFYEYDNLNRLSIIRDKDNNVVKKICYNYAGQPENCTGASGPVVYYNEPQSQTFTRNDCGACATGSQVTYSVPANTYSSTVSVQAANQLALNDIAANGQNYANANGTCTGSGVEITYNNLTNSAGFTATYTNSSSGQVYSFSVPASGSGALGCIPAGTYSLSISKPGNMMLVLFGTGCSALSGNSAYFNKVIVGPPSNCNMVTLEHDY